MIGPRARATLLQCQTCDFIWATGGPFISTQSNQFTVDLPQLYITYLYICDILLPEIYSMIQF